MRLSDIRYDPTRSRVHSRELYGETVKAELARGESMYIDKVLDGVGLVVCQVLVHAVVLRPLRPTAHARRIDKDK